MEGQGGATRQGVAIGSNSVQWHYIDKLLNDKVTNHTFITTIHQALFIYSRPKITGWFPVLTLKKVF